MESNREEDKENLRTEGNRQSTSDNKAQRIIGNEREVTALKVVTRQQHLHRKHETLLPGQIKPLPIDGLSGLRRPALLPEQTVPL